MSKGVLGIPIGRQRVISSTLALSDINFFPSSQ